MKFSFLFSLFIFFSCSTTMPEKKASLKYNRADYVHWVDLDKDCQDTREEILIRDSLVPVNFRTKTQCKVTSGKWRDPYTKKYFTNPRELDIDHIVPLKHAHEHGASQWFAEQRSLFANDPQNLMISSRSANRSKGEKAPQNWMPANKDFHCAYMEKWFAIKKKYRLGIDQEEANFLNRKRVACP